jgi:primosomal protein N' (replication factor Y) (superfamily II helicase)
MLGTKQRVAVALPLPVEQAFTYLVPAEMREDVCLGSRVLVPFGKKKLSGVVVDADAPPAEFKLRPIEDVLDDEPSLTPELLELTRWIADYYVCGWGEAIRAALPPGIDVTTRTRIHVVGPLPETPLTPAQQQLLDVILATSERTWSAVRKRHRKASLAQLRRLEALGFVTMQTELDEGLVDVRTETFIRRLAPPDVLREEIPALRGRRQQAIASYLASGSMPPDGVVSRKILMQETGSSTATVRSLEEKGLLEQFEREVDRSADDEPVPRAETPAFHPYQQSALDAILESVDADEPQTFLLHGVTGSGKTEVYIEALKRVRERGRTGIILVPEIALTPQTVRRFRAHFGDAVAVLHSRMSHGERYDAWRKIRRGECDVVVGPRSAVMAPLENIGLIVVDEEHEGSYKQFEPDPRYHARDVAVVRAHRYGAVCVLGSATPSLESLANARGGKYHLLEMPDRVSRPGEEPAPLPAIRVVDLTLERKKRRLDGALSIELADAIDERLARKEQVILLHNRRGFSPVIECAACGHVPECPDCSVSLTYHKRLRQLRCHFCGYALRQPDACPDCGERAWQELGAGTQRVEEELTTRFPDARLQRMDLDTTSRKGAHHRILEAFRLGEIDILLGTQMIAKGLDFPRVTLVGVINADTGLRMPDFRSDERSFQLLMQVAGRSGRAHLPGEVILQTRQPEHSVIQHCLRHDFNAFAELALEGRREHLYPPFSRIVNVEFRGEDERRVEQSALAWTQAYAAADGQSEILGPVPAFFARLRKQFRYHTVIKSPRARNGASLQEVLRKVQEEIGSSLSGVQMSIDIDPVALL